jgi:stage V sporulation protein G
MEPSLNATPRQRRWKMSNKKSEQAFDCLAVTNVQVFPLEESPLSGHLKATATIVLNDQLVIRGLRVLDGEYGLFVSYPNDPFCKGEYLQNLCNPLTRQLREHIENCVLEKYQATIE